MVPTQSNVIEGPATTGDGDKEWYYNLEKGDKVVRKGPVSFQQVCQVVVYNGPMKNCFI